jgi:N-methylhydantoinase A
MPLNAEAARTAIAGHVGDRLGIHTDEAAAAVLDLATEHMVRAIEEITLDQGVDPRTTVLVGGGGAAGFNAAAIARRLGCTQAVIPAAGAVLSAVGALMSDLVADFAKILWTSTTAFDFNGVNAVLRDLEAQCRQFASTYGRAVEAHVEFAAEARYPHQIWELEVPLRRSVFGSAAHVESLRQDFHSVHNDVFAISDVDSAVEIVGWRARVRCRLRDSADSTVVGSRRVGGRGPGSRQVYFREAGRVDVPVLSLDSMETGMTVEGPAIVESTSTTVVIDRFAKMKRSSSRSLVITPSSDSSAHALGNDRRAQ